MAFKWWHGGRTSPWGEYGGRHRCISVFALLSRVGEVNLLVDKTQTVITIFEFFSVLPVHQRHEGPARGLYRLYIYT